MTTVTFSLAPLAGTQPKDLDTGSFGSVVATQNGGFFVAFPNQDDDDVFGRLFDGKATALGGRLPVSNVSGDNDGPHSAVLTNGTIVTTYLHGDQGFLKLTGPTGATIKESFALPAEVRPQNQASVAALSNGGFVVSWTYQFGEDDPDVHAQRYNADGSLNGTTILVDPVSPTPGSQSSVAGLADGGFVVAYTLGPEGSESIVTKRYDAAGVLQQTKTVDNTGAANNHPEVLGLKDGGYAVAYTDEIGSGNRDLELQIFNADGTARSALLHVNEPNLSSGPDDLGNLPFPPTLTQITNGDIVVGWSPATNASLQLDVKARAFDPQGSPVTGIIDLASTEKVEALPSFAGLDGNHLAAIWLQADSIGSTFFVEGTVLELVRISTGTKSGEKIKGDSLADHMFGLGGGDKLLGGGGSDVLSGGGGGDTIKGGAGDDVITGGKGVDQLYAGKGDSHDVFVFGRGSSGTTGDTEDQVFGFDSHDKKEAVWDKIDLSGLDAKWRDVSFHTDGDNMKVLVDYKGTHAADLVIELVKVDHLSKADFII